MAKYQMFAWYDKVDKVYMPDSILLNEFSRPVMRGFLTSFERDRKMRIDEYALVKVGDFDSVTGVVTPLPSPEEIDPYQVLQEQPNTHGDVKPE